MNLHEYQAKTILSNFDVPIQRGKVTDNINEVEDVAKSLNHETGTEWFVVKAQIHAGGRGKGGGVKVAKSIDELKNFSSDILGMMLKTPQTPKEGKLVQKILIAEDVYYPGESDPEEYYFSVLLNRNTSKYMIMYSRQGGMDIEKVAEETPDLIFYEEIDPLLGLMPNQLRTIAFNLGLSGQAFKNMLSFASKLYNAFIESDASLLEINPVLKTSDNKILAVDAKMVLDDNSLIRHKNYEALRDLSEENPVETEAKEVGLNYVDLDGNIGCMVNGAGLAMATMDLIKQSGGEPANFLDVGGTADAKRVEVAFNLILIDPKVKAVLVNIFGGIVRCDRVANGIVDAYKNMGDKIKVPIIVRLQGTNAEQAKEIIDNAGLKIYSAVEFSEVPQKIKEVLN
ncbi:MAG: ADP-forming succinate--CoA ligase subunit beta [Flavobacteriaceae bacterium]|nr:ADP-forming succinate--CoA ligase subunit beta [Flavobacteriaceae bacterium]MBL6684488.1 ADP-forming succinate--CoA ligase subunit beta [Flavobacteriaceae bacterium]